MMLTTAPELLLLVPRLNGSLFQGNLWSCKLLIHKQMIISQKRYQTEIYRNNRKLCAIYRKALFLMTLNDPEDHLSV